MLRDAYAVTVSETALEDDSTQLLQLNKSALVDAVSLGKKFRYVWYGENVPVLFLFCGDRF